MKTIELTVVRHGETKLNVQKAFVGTSDDNLTDRGRIQADMIGKYLLNEGYKFDLVLVSPLKRAIETAKIIKKYLEFKIVKEPLLRERNYGVFEGKTAEKVSKLYPDLYLSYKHNKPFTKPTNGETCFDVEARIFYLLNKKIQENYPNARKILLVTHLNPVRAVYRLLNLADWDIYYRVFRNTSVSKFETNFKQTEIILEDFSCVDEPKCLQLFEDSISEEPEIDLKNDKNI
jgi:broad specificity phosphatase PhoE